MFQFVFDKIVDIHSAAAKQGIVAAAVHNRGRRRKTAQTHT